MIFILKIAFMEPSWVDLFDVSLVALLLYQIYKLIKGSIAFNIFFGILSLYFIYLIVRAAQMELLSSILGKFMSIGMLAALILFQQEIRKFLLVIGKGAEVNRNTLLKSFGKWYNPKIVEHYIQEIIETLKTLKATHTGALIIFSKDSQLKFYVETGDEIDATVSRRLLLSIFNKESPLHDGAVIIHKGRIKAARCVLPLSENDKLPPHYGLRHRSAIGMSENTTVLVVAISEETGRLLVARNGTYKSNVTLPYVKQRINDYMEDKESKV